MKQKSTTTSENEQYLIDGIAKGDSIILKKIYLQYSLPIHNLVKDNNGTQEDAKDVFQDAILIIYNLTQRKKIVLSSSFFTFFYAICQRVWWKKLRKRRTTKTIKENLEKQKVYVENIKYHDERYDLFHQELKALPKEKQQLMELYLNGFRMKEIAQQLQLKSEDYARKLKYKCKKQLIQKVQQHIKYKELTT